MILPYACAIEMIHTSSLILDDIMDKDDYRRGQLACHKKYDLGIALMASQFICSEAYLLLDKADLLHEILPVVRDMCIGQSEEIAELKTGSLIRAAVRIGGIVGGAKEEQLQALTIFGEDIGYFFQLRDDMLDGDTDYDALEVPLSSIDIFGEKAENLRQIARFIVTRTE